MRKSNCFLRHLSQKQKSYQIQVSFILVFSELSAKIGQHCSCLTQMISINYPQINWITDIYRLFQFTTTGYSFFSSSHETFTKTDYILGHTTHFNKNHAKYALRPHNNRNQEEKDSWGNPKILEIK